MRRTMFIIFCRELLPLKWKIISMHRLSFSIDLTVRVSGFARLLIVYENRNEFHQNRLLPL